MCEKCRPLKNAEKVSQDLRLVLTEVKKIIVQNQEKFDQDTYAKLMRILRKY